MQEIVEAAVVRLGRPPSEATRFVELFSTNWIESLEDYMAYHDAPQLGRTLSCKPLATMQSFVGT